MYKKILTGILSVLISGALFGVELGIDDAVKLAIQNNIEVKNSEKTLENYQLMRKEAVKEGLPKLKYTGQYSREEGNDDNQGLTQLSIEQKVFVGGAVLEAIKVSKITTEYGEIELEQKKRDTKLKIINTYTGIMKLEETIETMKKSLEELNENYKKLNEKYELNMIAKTPLLDLKYRIIELESSIMDMENKAEISRMTLKKEIGLDAEEELVLKKETIPVEETAKIDFKKDMEYAKEINLSIKTANITSKLKKSSEVIDRADLLPKVMFSFNYGNIKGPVKLDDSLKDENMNWNAAISVSMDLWDWGKNYDKYKRVKNETEKTRNTEKDITNNIIIGIKSSYLELLKIEKLIEAAKESVESSQENYILQKEKFEAGLISSTDFLSAENQMIQSKVTLINTKYDYMTAYHEYLNIIGK